MALSKIPSLAVGLCSLAFLSACQETPLDSTSEPPLASGAWHGAIALNDSVELAFAFRLEMQEDSSYLFEIANAEDRIPARMERLSGDSFRLSLPVFASYFELKALSDSSLQGFFVNPDAEDYRLPFSAQAGDQPRYQVAGTPSEALSGRWAAALQRSDGSERPAILALEPQPEEGRVFASIMTETGDYRFLEGQATAEGLALSTFDGGYLSYFEAQRVGDSLIGRYYSGRSFSAPWKAWRDSSFALRDPEKLTYLKKGYHQIAFARPDLNGDTLRLSDSRFAGKAVVIQIMGSWCPNCLDESRYLNEVYARYHQEGLAMIGLSFERARDRETAVARLAKMKKDLAIPYPLLLATATAKEPVEDVLPMLNHIMSFPTTIWLDRNHQVRKIHTGFAGPGTPVYETYVAENEKFIRELLAP